MQVRQYIEEFYVFSTIKIGGCSKIKLNISYLFDSYDYVALYDGPNKTSPLIIRHCGQSKPDPDTFVSTGNQMYVRLKADGSVAAKGFSANYSWVLS